MELGVACDYTEEPADDLLAEEYRKQYGYYPPRGRLTRSSQAITDFWSGRLADIKTVPEFLRELELESYDTP